MISRVFSYGSNMCRQRIQDRVGSASALCTAFLTHHELRFHKRGRDGSAKADAFHTGVATDILWGVVFEIATHEKPILDRHEGLGTDYHERPVIVGTMQGESITATMYLARTTMIDATLRPFSWYKKFVVAGARQHDLPADYLQSLHTIEAIADHNPARHAHNLRLIM